MSAVDDVDELIEQFHLAQEEEFVKGNPKPCKRLFSHRRDAVAWVAHVAWDELSGECPVVADQLLLVVSSPACSVSCMRLASSGQRSCGSNELRENGGALDDVRADLADEGEELPRSAAASVGP